jgi:glycogen(starch) synthase
MRVLYWTESFWPRIGGSEVAGMLLLQQLQRRGHRFEVVTRQWSSDHPATDSWQGIPIHRIPFDEQMLARRDRDALQLLLGRAAAIKRRFNPDLIHIGLTGPSLFLHQFTAWQFPVPSTITLHVAPLEGEYGKHKPVQEALRSASSVAAVSHAMAARIRERLPELADRCVVIHNALPEPAAPPTPVSFAPPRLLCVGRVTRQKGFDTAVAAMPRVREAFPDAELVIVGDGDARQSLVELSRQLRVSECVHMTGWAAPEDVSGLIDGATLVLMPSRSEAFGLVALQAAQRSRVCVASRVDGLPEVVQHERTGLLLPPDEPEQWAAAICELLCDPQRVTHLGAAARQWVSQQFKLKEHVDAYESLYQQCAGGTCREEGMA